MGGSAMTKGHVKVDIRLEITYDMRDPKLTEIKTNAKNTAVEEILENYILSQAGTGADGSKPSNRRWYKIVIGLDLGDDTFFTESNTGNKGLTVGIVMAVLKDLKNLKISSLS